MATKAETIPNHIGLDLTWNDPLSWEEGKVPVGDVNVYVRHPSHLYLVDFSASVHGLRVDGAASFEIGAGGHLTTASFDNFGRFFISPGGSLLVTGNGPSPADVPLPKVRMEPDAINKNYIGDLGTAEFQTDMINKSYIEVLRGGLMKFDKGYDSSRNNSLELKTGSEVDILGAVNTHGSTIAVGGKVVLPLSIFVKLARNCSSTIFQIQIAPT